MSHTPENPPARDPVMDALRVFGMLLVVTGHSAIPYAKLRTPDLLWAVHDPAASFFFDTFCLWALALSMPLFFWMGGFWAARQWENKGPAGFLKERTRRLTIPFLVAVVFVLPPAFWIWSYGWFTGGLTDLRGFLVARFESDFIGRNLYGPGHLWFLEYLILYSVLFWFFKKVFPDKPVAGKKTVLGWEILVWIAVSVTFLALAPQAVFNFRNSFVPDPLRFFYYWIFFVFGVWLQEKKADLACLVPKGPLYALASVPAWWGTSFFFTHWLAAEPAPAAPWMLGACMALLSWFLTLACLGIFPRLFSKPSFVIGYLSQASYWVYFVHILIVGALHVLFFHWAVPAGIKYLLTVNLALVLSLWSYEKIARQGLPEFSARTKAVLTATVLLVTLAAGATWQYFYNREKTRYEAAVTGFYRKHLGRDPDAIGLRHWVTVAMNKWGLEKVERIGFIEARQNGAR